MTADVLDIVIQTIVHVGSSCIEKVLKAELGRLELRLLQTKAIETVVETLQEIWICSLIYAIVQCSFDWRVKSGHHRLLIKRGRLPCNWSCAVVWTVETVL